MVDVTVYGAGIFGLSIAWACAKRGAKLRVIDPFGPGAGSSGGLVGALAPHVPENWNPKKAFQLDSLLMAESFWREIEETGGVSSGYGRTGRLQPIADAHYLDLAKSRESGAATLWQGYASWQVIPKAEVGEWCPDSPTGFVIHDTLSARLHPRRAIAALAAALSALGVEIVTSADEEGLIVHAKGSAGFPSLNADLGKNVGAGIKGQAALLQFDAGLDQPQLFIDGIHYIPHADGTLAIGSTSEREFGDPSNTDQLLEDIIEKARSALPSLRNAAVIDRWAGLRPRARSRAPMLGQWPGRSDHFIANGGFKIGFGMAPKVAEVMADLLLDGTDNIPEGFRVKDSLVRK